MDPIDLFLFANRQSSLADRLDGLLHSGRPLNRMGLVEFIPFQVKWWPEWVVLGRQLHHIPPTMIFVFCFLLIQHLYTLGHLFYFLSTSFPEPIFESDTLSAKKKWKKNTQNEIPFFFIHSLGFIYD
jgi:hypothetical protein